MVSAHLSSTQPVINSGFVDLQCSVSQLALAWVAKVNPYTSSIILGATKPRQVIENLGAIDVLPKLTPEILEKIEKVLDNEPTPIVSCCLLPPSLAPLLMHFYCTVQPVVARQPYDKNFHALA